MRLALFAGVLSRRGLTKCAGWDEAFLGFSLGLREVLRGVGTKRDRLLSLPFFPPSPPRPDSPERHACLLQKMGADELCHNRSDPATKRMNLIDGVPDTPIGVGRGRQPRVVLASSWLR